MRVEPTQQECCWRGLIAGLNGATATLLGFGPRTLPDPPTCTYSPRPSRQSFCRMLRAMLSQPPTSEGWFGGRFSPDGASG